MNFFLFALACAYFMLPAYVANMVPVMARRVNFLSLPVNEKIFGKNKTWRGLIFGTFFGTIVFGIQKFLFSNGARAISLIDYANFSLLLGVLLSFGALAGDMGKSFVKRKFGFKPGQSWVPFDQLDFVIGALALSMIIVILPIKAYAIILVASPLLHIAVNHLAYYLKIRNEKW